MLDQSRLECELLLQLRTCHPSEIQHLSVYVPDPRHSSEPEQCPNVHPKYADGLYIDTSKHPELASKIELAYHSETLKFL